MLSVTEAQDLAKAEANELAADPFWQAAFAGAAPRPPVFVKNLSKPALSYFLVDFQKGADSTGRILIHSETGVVGQVTGIETEGEALPPFIPPEEVDARVAGPNVTLPDGRLISIPPLPPSKELVWLHSEESRTMFQPSYRLTWVNNQELFLRIDGMFHERLTPSDESPI
jgi:hypothetical protein